MYFSWWWCSIATIINTNMICYEKTTLKTRISFLHIHSFQLKWASIQIYHFRQLSIVHFTRILLLKRLTQHTNYIFISIDATVLFSMEHNDNNWLTSYDESYYTINLNYTMKLVRNYLVGNCRKYLLQI